MAEIIALYHHSWPVFASIYGVTWAFKIAKRILGTI